MCCISVIDPIDRGGNETAENPALQQWGTNKSGMGRARKKNNRVHDMLVEDLFVG